MNFSLLVMSKSPVLGYVKTRMQPRLSQQKSLQLHIALTQYCLKQWSTVDGLSIQLWVGGDIENFQSQVLSPMGDEFVGKYGIYSQPEGDLGKKMSFAVTSVFNKNSTDVEANTQSKHTQNQQEGVFLVGTDCPFIDEKYLALAKSELEKTDVVIGPATDGGYVLIGMKKSYPALFDNILWGSSSVLKKTQSIILQENLQSVLLPPLPDIDVVGDLEHLDGYEEFSIFKV
ncbi:hypothetical protein IMCC1989_374 [gamma proteobacterium IMCC1989]|nr:hypothetical protein IMCC1989_374 [gamma proteobacterium IMCC1989]